MVNKKIIIINGKGGVGKDTLISSFEQRKKCHVMNISSIEPVRQLVKYDISRYLSSFGVDININDKTDKNRKLLSDLKQIFNEYCDLSFRHIEYELKCFVEFIMCEYCFIHIREPEEISRIYNYIKSNYDISVSTLLITRETADNWSNSSDSNVNSYNYDYVFDNNDSLAKSCDKFYKLLEGI